MKRILILGSGGAGKSTLARALGDILQLPVIHLDALYWQPGWVETPKDQWAQIVAAQTRCDAWIMDGNYGGTMESRLAAADTVIFLDFPNWLCCRRVLKRGLQYAGRTRPDMGADCPEKVDWEFLRWIWNYPTRSRPTVKRLLEEQGEDKRVLILSSPAQVRDFLSGLLRNGTGGTTAAHEGL